MWLKLPRYDALQSSSSPTAMNRIATTGQAKIIQYLSDLAASASLPAGQRPAMSSTIIWLIPTAVSCASASVTTIRTFSDMLFHVNITKYSRKIGHIGTSERRRLEIWSGHHGLATPSACLEATSEATSNEPCVRSSKVVASYRSQQCGWLATTRRHS